MNRRKSATNKRSIGHQSSSGDALGGLVLPWHVAGHGAGHGATHFSRHVSARRDLAQAMLLPAHSGNQTVHGALALLQEVPAPQVYPHVPRPAAARPSILLAQDDVRLARMVRSALELEGDPVWAVEVAGDGASALDLAAASPPQVVLLDLFLPHIDGAQVYKRLRADPLTAQARVIFVSAATSLDLYERGIEDGILLRKPFELRDLVRLVRMLMAQ